MKKLQKKLVMCHPEKCDTIRHNTRNVPSSGQALKFEIRSSFGFTWTIKVQMRYIYYFWTVECSGTKYTWAEKFKASREKPISAISAECRVQCSCRTVDPIGSNYSHCSIVDALTGRGDRGVYLNLRRLLYLKCLVL